MALLIARAILFLSNRYQWFDFNRQKWSTVLLACAVTLLVLLVGMDWLLRRLFIITAIARPSSFGRVVGIDFFADVTRVEIERDVMQEEIDQQ